jgi:hypothetical protein
MYLAVADFFDCVSPGNKNFVRCGRKGAEEAFGGNPYHAERLSGQTRVGNTPTLRTALLAGSILFLTDYPDPATVALHDAIVGHQNGMFASDGFPARTLKEQPLG